MDATPDKPRDRQLEFNFSRTEKLAVLREAELRTSLRGKDGKTVSPVTLKAVLKVLDDHIGTNHECWLSFPTIAKEAGPIGERTAKRAMEILEALSVVCVETKRCPAGVVCNHYRIVWSELSLRRQPRSEGRESAHQPAAAALRGDASSDQPSRRQSRASIGCRDGFLSIDRSATRTDQSATRTDQSATRTDRSATVALKAPPEAFTKRLPPASPAIAPTAERLDQGEGWAAVRKELMSAGIRRAWDVTRACSERGETPAELLERLRKGRRTINLPANARRFARPTGALAWFLQSGEWPADGVVDPDRQQQRSDELANQVRFTKIVHDCRQRGLNDDQIREQLAAELPEEFLKEQGF